MHNAVKYADHALGQFIERARASDYWADTLFLVVADHDTRVYGDELVPVGKFHIPGVIVGADVTARRIDSLVSQIDLAPTLLSLMGVDSEHPFPGRDLTRTLPEFGNSPAPVPARAMMQFDQNFAWLERDRLTVLLPDGSSRQFMFDRRTKKLDPARDHRSRSRATGARERADASVALRRAALSDAEIADASRLALKYPPPPGRKAPATPASTYVTFRCDICSRLLRGGGVSRMLRRP